MPHISWLAVIGSTVAAFILGGLWYGPLFSKPWMHEMGVGRDFKPNIARSVLFGLAVLFNFVSALVFAAFVGPAPSLLFALGASVAVGFAWVAPSIVIVYLFAARSVKLAVIDAGYAAAQFFLFGVIFFAIG